MSHLMTTLLLTLTLVSNLALSQSLGDGYETLFRDNLPVIRSKEFGATNGPDSEIFTSPLFCLQCEGRQCEHHYVLAVNIDDMVAATRTLSPNSSSSDLSAFIQGNVSAASGHSNVVRQQRMRLNSVQVGRSGRRAGACADQEHARRVSYDRVRNMYTLGCGGLPPRLRNNPGDTRVIPLRKRPLSRQAMTRQVSPDTEQYEALCDNGYYIWGMACADSACDDFVVICIRVLVVTNRNEEEEPSSVGRSRVCNSRVCCPLSCGTCGGSGCSSRDGGTMNCCESNIRLFSPVCSGRDEAPCVLSPEFVISTTIDSNYLQYCNGRVCCAPSCGTCGGRGCGSRNGGANNCCTSHISASGKICRGHEDFPCIMA